MTRRRSVLVAVLVCALCGGWAGAGSGHLGTFALLSDSAAVTADAGAGTLWLTRVLPPGESQDPVALVGPDAGAEVLVSISTSRETSWVLTARVLPVGDTDADCGPLAGNSLSIEASGPASRTVAACGSEAPIARGTGAAVSTVVVRWAGASDGAAWEGRVQLVVTQEGGGFSDRLDVPVGVLPPALLPPPAGGPVVLPQTELPPTSVVEDEDPSTQEPAEPVAEAPATASPTASSPSATTSTPAPPTVAPAAPAASTPVPAEAPSSDGPPTDAPISTESGATTLPAGG